MAQALPVRARRLQRQHLPGTQALMQKGITMQMTKQADTSAIIPGSYSAALLGGNLTFSDGAGRHSIPIGLKLNAEPQQCSVIVAPGLVVVTIDNAAMCGVGGIGFSLRA